MSNPSSLNASLRPVDLHDQPGMVARLAAYVASARGKPAPEPERQAALRCILDLLGAVGAGLEAPGAKAVRAMALSAMGAGSIPIWFSGQCSSVIGAAWANSAAGSVLDLDDGHRLARGHPGAAVIPTAFAVGQEARATFEDILSAIVIGYEVGVAIGAARTTYGNTGTWSAYAVVATAAALRGTSCDVLEHALAIAGESAPNQLFASAPIRNPAPEGSDVKEGIPWSVVTGLAALGLAEAGHTGPRNILDSAAHYRFPEGYAPGAASHIRHAYFKLYACCRHVHAPLDALQEVMAQHGIAGHEIERIHVHSYSGALRISNKTRPGNLVDIQYSIPYCLALVALHGPQTLLPLTHEALHHDEVSALAGKITLSLDQEIEARFPAETLTRLVVTSKGQDFISRLTAPQGEASQPLSWAQLEEKLKAATRRVATGAEQARLLAAMNEARAGKPAALLECFRRLTFGGVLNP